MAGERLSDEELRRRLDFSDAQLLAECEVHTYRASGPGGQKRNKTSSAVRLHHKPSGLIAPAEESRSQHENKARALKRLRESIGVSYRAKFTEAEPFVWPPGVVSGEGVLRVSEKNPERVRLLAAALDALAAREGRVSEAAALLSVTASSLTRFLADSSRAWAEVNRIRAAASLAPLRKT